MDDLDKNGLTVGDWIETGFGMAQIAEFEVDDDDETLALAVGVLDGNVFRLSVFDLKKLG